MRSSVTVSVPGSTSNLGAGFDCIGVAVERRLTVTARQAAGPDGAPVTIERRGTLNAVASPPDQDLLYRGFLKACQVAGRTVPLSLVLTAESDIPVARGLGSSAAATVAGAAAATALLELGLGDDALAALCTEVEGHPDNVAPAVYGGALLVLREPRGGLTVTRLAIHDSLVFVFAVPDFVVETKQARAVLPATVLHATAVEAAARSAALVHGLTHAEPRLLAAGLDDVLHVRTKEPLLRLVQQQRIARESISGLYLYCSIDRALRQRQLLARRVREDEPTLASSLTGREAVDEELKAALVLFLSMLNEKQRRLYAGLESLKLGYGGDQRIADFIGMDPHTIAKGRRELAEHDLDIERIRKVGGGRRHAEKKRPKSSRKLKS